MLFFIVLSTGCKEDSKKKPGAKQARSSSESASSPDSSDPRPAPRGPASEVPSDPDSSASVSASADSSDPAPTALVPVSVQGHAQFFKSSAKEVFEIQECQLTTGRVTAYSPDGSVIAQGELSPSGSFVLPDVAGKTSFPHRAVGLQPGEIRVVIDLPDGSTLMADSESQESFVHVSPLTTVLSVARRNRPGLTSEQAEDALRSYFDLPAAHALEDMGGETTAFCETEFFKVALAWNQQNDHPLEDVDIFVEEVEDGVQDHVDGVRVSIEPFRSILPAASLMGIREDNTDPLGSLDPDQGTGPAGEAGIFNPSSFEKAGNLGLANTIVSTSCSGLESIAAAVLLFDGAGGNSGVSPLTKWVGGFGVGVVVTQMISSIVLSVL